MLDTSNMINIHIGFFFCRSGFNRVTVLVSLSNGVWKTLHGLFCSYFLPKVMVQLMKREREHFMMFIEDGMKLNEQNSGDICETVSAK